MAFANKILTSLHGRRLGIQSLSSAESGSGRGTQFFLAGSVADIRRDVSTAETTSVNLLAHGVSVFGSTSTAAARTYTLDPPVPGVRKTIVVSCGASDGTFIVKTANAETIESTAGSSFTQFTLSTKAVIDLMGVTTARWMTAAASAAFTLLSTSA